MKSQYAAELFRNGFVCSQAILAAFCGSYGLDRHTALKITAGFGSGMRCAEICGAVSGAVLVIGLKYGHTEAKDRTAKENCDAKVKDFLRAFTERNGHIICRDILGCDISTPEGIKKAREEKLFTTVCADMVVSAATVLEEQGYQLPLRTRSAYLHPIQWPGHGCKAQRGVHAMRVLCYKQPLIDILKLSVPKDMTQHFPANAFSSVIFGNVDVKNISKPCFVRNNTGITNLFSIKERADHKRGILCSPHNFGACDARRPERFRKHVTHAVKIHLRKGVFHDKLFHA
jgi:C_GCAxxG_C_C family probable redox protein